MISHESLKNGPVSVNDDKYYYELFLDLYESTQSFKKIMAEYGDTDDMNAIREMFYEGLKGKGQYKMFFFKLSRIIEEDNKKIFMEYLERGLSVVDILNQEDFWYDIKTVRKWYGLGYNGNRNHRRFFEIASSILKSKHQDMVAFYVDKGFSLKDACMQEDICCTPNEVEFWISNDPDFKIRKKDTEGYPRKKSVFKRDKGSFHNSNYLKNNSNGDNQFNLILDYLINGFSLKDTLNQSDVEWDIKQLKEHYLRLYSSSFWNYEKKREYDRLSQYLRGETKKNIIYYLKNGMPLKEVFEQYDVFCVEKEFRTWYREGFSKNGSNRGFHNNISPILEKEFQIKIIEYLEDGMDIERIFNKWDVIPSKEEYDVWCNKGNNGNENYVKFFNKVSSIFTDRNRKILINAIKKGRILGDLSDFKVTCNVDEIKQWYFEDKNNPDNKLLFETVIQEEIFNIMKKEQVLFDYTLENNSFDIEVEKIMQWYELGKAGKDYINFYNKIIELDETIKMDRTKKGIIDIVRKGVSLDDVLRNYAFDYPSDVIRDWYENGKFGIAPHTYFAKEIDAFSKKEKPFKLNPGGFVR